MMIIKDIEIIKSLLTCRMSNALVWFSRAAMSPQLAPMPAEAPIIPPSTRPDAAPDPDSLIRRQFCRISSTFSSAAKNFSSIANSLLRMRSRSFSSS